MVGVRKGVVLYMLAEEKRARECTNTKKPFGYVHLCSLSSVNHLHSFSLVCPILLHPTCINETDIFIPHHSLISLCRKGPKILKQPRREIARTYINQLEKEQQVFEEDELKLYPKSTCLVIMNFQRL